MTMPARPSAAAVAAAAVVAELFDLHLANHLQLDKRRLPFTKHNNYPRVVPALESLRLRTINKERIIEADFFFKKEKTQEE